MSDSALAFVRTIQAPPSRVFATLTEARELCAWFCDESESEPRVNGRLVLRWRRADSSSEPFEARWVEFAPPLRAAFRGGHSGYPDRDAGTVRFTLAPADPEDATLLEVRHDLPARAGYEALIETWRHAWVRALDRLERHLECAAGPAA